MLPMDTRRQLLRALKTRYQAASKSEKTRILEEFILISGYHRKSAIRLLNGAVTNGSQQRRSAPARSVYGAAVQQALIVLWEASDRLCGKRLKALLPQLIPALEKHGHLCLNPALREQLLKVSASSIDRLLKDAHTTAGKKGSVALRRSQVTFCFFGMFPDDASEPKRLQTPALSRRCYCSVCPMVSGLFPEPAKSGRDNGRAWGCR